MCRGACSSWIIGPLVKKKSFFQQSRVIFIIFSYRTHAISFTDRRIRINFIHMTCLIMYCLMMSRVFTWVLVQFQCLFKYFSHMVTGSCEVCVMCGILKAKLKLIEGFKSWNEFASSFSLRIWELFSCNVRRRGRRDEGSNRVMLRVLVWNNQANVILTRGDGIVRPDSDQNNGIDLSKSHSPIFFHTIERLATNAHYTWLCITSSIGTMAETPKTAAV